MKSFLQNLNESLQRLHTASMHALWMVLTTGRKEWAERCEAEEIAYQEALAAVEWQPDQTGKSNRCERRQLEILERERLDSRTSPETRRRISQVWNELNVQFAAYRPTSSGKQLTEQQILRELLHCPDQTYRKQLWQASMGIGQHIAPKLLELVELRNQVARQNGFDNYYVMKLESQELSLDLLDSLFTALRKGLDSSYQSIMAEIDEELAAKWKLPKKDRYPWRYPHPFVQEYYSDEQSSVPVDLQSIQSKLIDYFHNLGFAIAEMLANANLTSQDGKAQTNFCLHIDRAGDIRISCNLDPSVRGIAILLHELGHAVYEQGIDRTLPFLLRQPAQLFLSEAVAALMERLALDPHWLSWLLDTEIVQPDSYRRRWQNNLLVRLYWTMTVVSFERQLYENPGQPLNRLWWDLVEEIQGLSRPLEWDYPYWACKPHLTTLPVYYQNYLLGECAAAQLQDSLNQRYGCWNTREAMQQVQECVFSPGISHTWSDIWQTVCGSTLQSEPIVEQLRK
ncbi:M2 family metallopeptidase [Brevibacillus fulvus]|uniref:Peptidyl-dipeptidase A n=1 Tax=Brevibacillus fulvus TaxID=1125967 RepID=A0A938Y132_9BACL|nr:M2 family metallopeptidase [Brevibacillus fulvus]MBM7589647.1 peptidyl-dipeptidase A [Brevibacillus fulvus]